MELLGVKAFKEKKMIIILDIMVNFLHQCAFFLFFLFFLYNSGLKSKAQAKGRWLLKQLIPAKRMSNEGRHGGEEQRVCHVLFNTDLVRNVEQFFHMGDLQEGQHGRGGAGPRPLCHA